MRLVGGGAVYHALSSKQPLSNDRNKLSSKMQNGMWMSTSRRSICDNYFFPKHS